MKKTHFSFLAKVNLIVLLILGLAISFFYFREEKREEMACYQMIKKQTQVVADMLRRCNSVSQIQSLLNDIQTCWKDLLHLQLIDTQGNIVAATQKKEMGYKTRAQETGFSFPIKNSFFQGTMKVYIASADICENFLKNKAERRNEAILTFIVALTVFTTLTYIVVTRYENTITRKTAERLKAENALMTEKIKQSERLAVLGRMAASLAHEIRTPLTSIKNLAQLLEEEYADPAFRKEFQELVVSEVERINRIIKALLTYAKPLNLQKGRVRLDNLIEETLAGLKEAGQMEKIRIKKSLKPIEVKANKGLIRQVLENIILNACEAMAGQGTISISLYPEGEKAIISIKDNGPGIKEKDKPHIFMPFFTTKTKGTGLGLALCEKIITAHGGEITFHTQKGKGTTFYIYLPME
jgi:signal transduction histidine kinase